MKMIAVIRRIIHYLNLESELDNPEKVHEAIVKDTIFRGTNLWILVFAIIVASVGLNTNSTAVIIGAMLISPLMGPINGIGYSLATYNLDLFRQSLKNLSFAVLASLAASTAYFAMSPLSTAHSELLARTTPTIYDVLIALFGGMAGIVAATSKQKGNVIPGVAIATALMPPLCTAGYGLATGQFNFFLGAFYLFTINSVFIALASVIISQILNFPIRAEMPTSRKKYINRWISVVIALVLIPSIYFGYILVQKERFREYASRYIADVSTVNGNYLLKNDIDDKNKTITLVYAGISLNESQKDQIISKAENFSLKKTSVIIKQGLALEILNEKNTEVAALKEEIIILGRTLNERNSSLDSLRISQERGKVLLEETRTLFPAITACTYSESLKFMAGNETGEKITIIIFNVEGRKLTATDKKKIKEWLSKRLSTEKVFVYFE